MSVRHTDRAGEVVYAAQQLLQAGLVVGTVGNVSVRAGRFMLITPTRTAYQLLQAEDIVTVSLDDPVAPSPPASREWRLHAEIYAARADVLAVVHTHSVHATAWSFRNELLLPQLEDADYYDVGLIHTAPAAPAGSHELAVSAAATIGTSKAVLLGDHGVLACGTTLSEAVDIAHVVERQAQIAWLLHPSQQAALGPDIRRTATALDGP